jgi:hypothetical protein
MRDIIGNGELGDHTASKVEPTLDDAKRVTSDDVRWVLGAAVKIKDADTETGDFIVTHISVEYCDIWDFIYDGGL